MVVDHVLLLGTARAVWGTCIGTIAFDFSVAP